MKLIHTWSYRNPSGEIIGLVKRFEEWSEQDKEFKKQVVPYFKNENGTWAKGGAEKPRPLFNWHLIQDSKQIIIVEGEKCAQALAHLGCVAVSSCGGSSGTKEADWAACAKAERILLMPDADMPGETYIEQVARHISALNKSAKFFVRRVNNGLMDSADIVDWIQYRAKKI